MIVFPRILFPVWNQVRAGHRGIFLRWGSQKWSSHNSADWCRVPGRLMAHPIGMEQHLGLQFLQLPHSLLLQILWAASLLCLEFHGEGASFCRSPALSNLEVIRDNHGFWPMLIGSSVSHASSLCFLPHFTCCIPSWLSKLLTHSDFSSPPDAEATACHWVHQLSQLCKV